MKKVFATTAFILASTLCYSMPTSTTASSHATLEVNVLGYVLTQPADLGVIQFPEITDSDMHHAQTQEGGPIQFSAITTYPPEYAEPNIALKVTVGDNHVINGKGAYLTNSDAPDSKIFYTLKYTPCNDATAVPLISTGSNATPVEIIPNADASESACLSSPGHLTFTRQAIDSAYIPPAGEYTGTINITAQAANA